MINIIKKCKISFVIIIFKLVILSLILTACSSDEEIAVLQAGLDDIPIIQNDDLQELGELYSTLNDEFEREIDLLVTGEANRHNKKNDKLVHYGVYARRMIIHLKMMIM